VIWGSTWVGCSARAAEVPGCFSHQRNSAGFGGGAGAGTSSIFSMLRSDTQSGSQHSCSRLTSSVTCGSRSAASCFQAWLSNGAEKSPRQNKRFLELYRASQRPGSLLRATSEV
jgi:hypothetical protein